MTATREPRHGALSGLQHHIRAEEQPCDPCAIYQRGYNHGWKSRPRTPALELSPDAVKKLLAVCNAVVLGRPSGAVRQLATEALRAAKAKAS